MTMLIRHPDKLPSCVFANRQGEIMDFPGLGMAGRSGRELERPALSDLIPLPEGSELFVLPDRFPVGLDSASKRPVTLDCNPFAPSEKAQAIAAFMAPAHTAIYTAAFTRANTEIAPLPLFAYTAVGWAEGRFWVAAFRSDPDERQDSRHFQADKITQNAKKQLRAFPKNRLIQHLGKCCLTYGCPAARNYFLHRWEAPLPTSPVCNARCLGCISLQPLGSCPSTQERITFVPTAQEIVEVAVPHIRKALGPVVSFGQGCEGEPLLQAKTIASAIRLIRKDTAKGTINLNSNASLPVEVERLAAIGLDSLRVSMNSARKIHYERYYRPQGYDFTDVLSSIAVMKKAGRFVSLNYFILPGLSDDPEEFSALCGLIEAYRPDMLQLRNLNMDPDWYLDAVAPDQVSMPMGIRRWRGELIRRFPHLRLGYYNPYLGEPGPLSLSIK